MITVGQLRREDGAEYGTLSLGGTANLMEQGSIRKAREDSIVSTGPPSPQWRGTLADLEEKPNYALMWLSVCCYFGVGCSYYAYSTKWGWVDSIYFTMQTVTTVIF